MTRLSLALALLLLGVLVTPVGAIEGLSEAEALRVYAVQVAWQEGIEPAILLCLVEQESHWDTRAVSSRGARGLVQVMQQYHPGVRADDPYDSLRYAAQSIAAGLAEFGRYDESLAAWNSSTGAVRLYGGVPPYYETRLFVQVILACAAEAKGDE